MVHCVEPINVNNPRVALSCAVQFFVHKLLSSVSVPVDKLAALESLHCHFFYKLGPLAQTYSRHACLSTGLIIGLISSSVCDRLIFLVLVAEYIQWGTCRTLSSRQWKVFSWSQMVPWMVIGVIFCGIVESSEDVANGVLHDCTSVCATAPCTGRASQYA